MSTLLLKNGVVARATGGVSEDILIEDGKIVQILDELPEEGVDEVIDCSGKFILPGVIDAHVHFRVPGAEYKEDWTTGSKAAAAGGVTTVLDMPNNSPAITTIELLNRKRELINGQSFVNYGLYMGATVDSGTGLTNVEEYLESDAVALKVYMGSSTGDLLVDKQKWLDAIFEKAAAADRLLCVHAEDEELIEERMREFEGEEDPMVHTKIRNDEVAYRAVKYALHLAKKYGTRLHICHASTARELEEIHEFKNDHISCEVTPHHLFLNELELARRKNFAKMNPPLRKSEDQMMLMDGIVTGLVDMVATDHAPHTVEEKEQEYWSAPAGMPGVETMLPLLLDAVNRDKMELTDVVRLTSEGPARVFGMDRGRIEVGANADLVVVDMDLKQEVVNEGPGARYTKCGWSAFAGLTLHGWPIMTLVDGQIIMKDGEIYGIPGGREITS